MKAEERLETGAIMQGLANAIDGTLKTELGVRTGFALLIFNFDSASNIGNYISNAKREDMIKALRETATRLELKQDIPPIIELRQDIPPIIGSV